MKKQEAPQAKPQEISDAPVPQVQAENDKT